MYNYVYLSISIYIYLFLCGSIDVCIFPRISIFVDVFLCVSIHIYLYLSIAFYFYLYLSIVVCQPPIPLTYTIVRMCMHACMHAQTIALTCSYTRMHAHTHARVCVIEDICVEMMGERVPDVGKRAAPRVEGACVHLLYKHACPCAWFWYTAIRACMSRGMCLYKCMHTCIQERCSPAWCCYSFYTHAHRAYILCSKQTCYCPSGPFPS